MSKMFIGDSAIVNNKIVSATEISVDQNGAVYEVLRVENRIPLFWEENYNRMVNSIRLASINYELQKDSFIAMLKLLIAENNIENCNVKIVLTTKGQLIAGYIPSFYPPAEWYKAGVNVGVYHMVRPDPSAKIFRSDMRNEIERSIANENVYEVALVNDFGNITEGSRSNILFLKQDKIYSAPTNQILEGITRKIVLKLCREHNIEVVEMDIELNQLAQFESACITGTSPGVLPIRNIGVQSFNVTSTLLIRVMHIFDTFKNTHK